MPGNIAVCSPREFHAVIANERSRVDRDGRVFSLVVFQFDERSPSEACRSLLCRRISEEMRSIDEAGLLENRDLGVLLPAANREGGCAFAHRVTKVKDARWTPPPYEVYSYPEHWLEQFSDGKDRGTRTGCANEVERAFCRGIPPWKRVMDILGSIIGIVIAAPLMLVICVYIKAVSPGRILFRQRRVGLGGKLFTFLKFRTMHDRSDFTVHKDYLKGLIAGNMPMGKLDETRDRRIIPGGRFMRKCSLDELPQFLNVLIGNMSLVGPRPCIPYEAAEYLRWHTHRFDSAPGMTGLWQVSGKNKLTFQEMIRLDILYGERMSVRLDVKIILRTIPAILEPILSAFRQRLRRRKQTVAGEPDLRSNDGGSGCVGSGAVGA